jgi:hypothetical protein
MISIQLSALLVLFLSYRGGAVAAEEQAGSRHPAAMTHIVPRPKQMEADRGSFTFNKETLIVAAGNPAAKLEAQAKITKAEAQKIALDKVPGGTIKEGDLEKEKGKLLWSFDIATPGTKDITEVQVDAMTGAVLDIAKETVADQEKEKKEDAKMKAKKEKEDNDEKEEKK